MVHVLVLGATPDDPPQGLPETDTGATYAFADEAETLAVALPTADAILHWSNRTSLLRAAWPAAARLRWIHATGIGIEWSLFPELVESDVILTNCRGVFDETLPEYVLALLLALAKDLHAMVRDQDARRWRHRPLRALVGQRATVVGAGSLGRATARLLRSIGMGVILVGRRGRDDPDDGPIRAAEDLPTILPQTDALVLITPLTAQTRGLIDADALGALPDGALIVNMGRGPVLDEAALVEELRSGRLGGAALDVFEVEPLPLASPLWGLPNVIVSPHIGGDVPGWEGWFSRSFLEELLRFVAGEPLRNVVDKRLGYAPL
ncbi:MAG TPA: D-2-hydroxyacid dehydrogenase [Candidatus Limnocylindrales bacterium]|nr:D-2-hydroxyacid dehydrogenase [Candidatus Limnocylindrales bacterium]